MTTSDKIYEGPEPSYPGVGEYFRELLDPASSVTDVLERLESRRVKAEESQAKRLRAAFKRAGDVVVLMDGNLHFWTGHEDGLEERDLRWRNRFNDRPAPPRISLDGLAFPSSVLPLDIR